jgi:acyl carrier protein
MTLPMVEAPMQIESLIRKYIAESILFSGGDFPYADSASFLGEGIIDSMGVLNLVAFVEATFQISVPTEEIIPENFDSVQRLADYVRRKLARGGAHNDATETGDSKGAASIGPTTEHPGQRPDGGASSSSCRVGLSEDRRRETEDREQQENRARSAGWGAGGRGQETDDRRRKNGEGLGQGAGRSEPEAGAGSPEVGAVRSRRREEAKRSLWAWGRERGAWGTKSEDRGPN